MWPFHYYPDSKWSVLLGKKKKGCQTVFQLVVTSLSIWSIIHDVNKSADHRLWSSSHLWSTSLFFFPVSPYFLSHLHFCLCWCLPPVVTSGTSSRATEGKVCVRVCLLVCVLFYEWPLFLISAVTVQAAALVQKCVAEVCEVWHTHWCPLGFCNLFVLGFFLLLLFGLHVNIDTFQENEIRTAADGRIIINKKAI